VVQSVALEAQRRARAEALGLPPVQVREVLVVHGVLWGKGRLFPALCARGAAVANTIRLTVPAGRFKIKNWQLVRSLLRGHAMVPLPRTWLSLGVGLVALALAFSPGRPAYAQKKADFKKDTIKTFDGVKLSATYYPNAGGKKDACVLLLHNIDRKKGGHSHQDNQDELAAALQKKGYCVLQFDFRGFGDSKSVSEDFWKFPGNTGTNLGMKVNSREPPTTIDHKKFSSAYYMSLVHDIAAAKAYLDRRNDAGEANTSSVIIIGSGEGATLGALWLYTECSRYRDKTPPGTFATTPTLGDPEISDVAGAVWLSISPTLDRRRVPVSKWLQVVGKDRKVPMAFVHGKNDRSGETLANTYLRLIKGSAKGPKGGDYKQTGKKAIDGTSLTGSALLKERSARDWIGNTYLEEVMEKRGSKERVARKSQASTYYYFIKPRTYQVSKKGGEDAPQVVLSLFGIR
jgi:hypothetical protein